MPIPIEGTTPVPETAAPRVAVAQPAALGRVALRAGLGVALLALVGLAGVLVALADTGMNDTVLVWLVASVLGFGGLAVVQIILASVRDLARRADLLAASLEVLPDPLALVGPQGRAVVTNGAFRGLVRGPGDRPVAALAAACADGDSRALLDAVVRRDGGRIPPGGELRLGGDGATVPVMLELRRLTPAPDHLLWRLPGRPAASPWGALGPLLDRGPLGLLLGDGAGRVLDLNATLAGWLGLDSARAVAEGLDVVDLLEQPAAGAPPYALAAVPEGEPAAITLRGRDGRIIPVWAMQQSLLGTARVATLLLHRGQEVLLAGQLAREQRRFARFFDYAPIGVALVDAELKLVECNATFQSLAGLAAAEVGGRSLGLLVTREQRARLLDHLMQVLNGGDDGSPVEVRLRGSGGPVVHVYARRQDGAIQDPADTPGHGGLILHLVDMTNQKNLETQFVQSQKMQAIGQLAGGIAHDFNNLLTAMIGFCDLLLLRHKPGDHSFSDIMQIKQNANRAANLVRQLLAFSRQQALQPKVLNITDALAELSNLLRRLIGENIELKMVHGRDLGLVKVDQGQLEQVIINLAVNARDAMPNGGRLTILTANHTAGAGLKHQTEEMPPGDYVLVEVIDTGIGIPAENLSRIFEPFYSTKEVGAGTGLGLSTVYGIVRQTGGFVFVDSVVGEGTRFSIYLPRHQERPGAAAVPEQRERTATDLTGMGTILLVEDEDAVRMFGARALRNKGYQVLEAKNGESALEVLRRTDGPTIDLVVTDMVMPQMDGPTMVREVRKFRPDLKVIFISGYAEDRFRKSLGEEVAVEFLAKPFTLKQLASKVKETMGAS